MLTLLLIVGVLAFGYAHWKLHLSVAQIKDEVVAEIAKLRGK